MAKVTVKGFDTFKNSVFRRVNKAIDRSMNQFTREELRIKKQMRRGYQPFLQEKFPTLKKTTIENRKNIAINTPTHEQFKPKKSNITISGQLINAFMVDLIVSNTKQLGIKVFAQFLFKDTKRTKYIGKNNKPIGKTLTNSKVANYLEEIGHLKLTVEKSTITRLQETLKRNFYMFFK